MANRHKKIKKEKLRAFPQKSGRQHSVTHTPLEYEQREISTKAEPMITMRGSRWIHIENYASVIEYGDKKVSVSGQGWTLRIQGLRLRIAYFTEDDMLVCGMIQNVDFL